MILPYTCRRLVVVLVLLFAVASIAQGASPPPGIDWKEDLQSGKAAGAARKTAIMMFVADDGAASTALAKSMQDPKVMRMLRHFVCVFVSRSYNLQKFQQSYVPWIAATPQTTFQPPLLVFGGPDGNARQEYRISGKSLKPAELLLHLEKVLRALAPNEAKTATSAGLKSMTLAEYCARLDHSVSFLEANLTREKLALFMQEVQSALDTCKFLKAKLRRMKDKAKQAQANKHSKDLEKYLKKLARYRGKEKEQEKYEGYLEKTREALNGVTTAVENQVIETELLNCKAVPRSKKPGSLDALKSDLEKLDCVVEVSYEETDETVKVQGEEFKIAVFAVNFEKGKVKKFDVEKTFKKHNYRAKWVKE